MKKTVLTFGLISGAMISALMIIFLPFEENLTGGLGEILGYTTMLAAFLLVFFGVRSYRENVGHGRIGFGRALAVGALIALITSMCYTATWEIMYFGFKSDFAEKYAASAISKAKASGKSQAEIDVITREMQDFARKYHNPAYNSAMTMMEPLPLGLVIALVSAGVLSRRKRNGSLATVPA